MFHLFLSSVNCDEKSIVVPIVFASRSLTFLWLPLGLFFYLVFNSLIKCVWMWISLRLSYLGFLWTSWTCMFISFTNLRKFLAIISLLFSAQFSSLSRTLMTQNLDILQLSRMSLRALFIFWSSVFIDHIG